MRRTLEQMLHVAMDKVEECGGCGDALMERMRRLLQANADQAVALVASLKVAGPWSDGSRFALGHDAQIGETALLGRVRRFTRTSPLWYAELYGETLFGEEWQWASEQEAMGAVDALLLEDGWALAGGAAQAPKQRGAP